jgi:hypothetical protein
MHRVGGVISISSSASFEAAVMGIPTFLFSDSYYSHLPSILRVSDPSLLKLQLVEDHIRSVQTMADVEYKTADSLLRISINISKGDPQPSNLLFDQVNLANIALSLKAHLEDDQQ